MLRKSSTSLVWDSIQKCENCGSLGHQNMEQILFLVSFNKREKNDNGRIIC